jgi:hypothetical protein
MTTAAKKKARIRPDDKLAAPKANSKRAKKAKVASQFTPWTDEQVQILKDAVAAAPNASVGIRAATEKLGKNVGAVAQKWYKIKADAKPKAPAKVKASAKPKAAPVTPAAHSGQSSMYKWMQGQVSDIDTKIADLSAKKASIQSVIGEFERAAH